MNNLTKVTFSFINKKGLKKTVTFPMDAKYYRDLCDSSITDEQRNEILLYEYREYCNEIYHQRRFVSFLEDEEGNYIEPADKTSIPVLEQMVAKEEKEELHNAFMNILNNLSVKQKEAITHIYIDELNQSEAAQMMNMKKSAFSRLLSRAKDAVEKIVGKKIF